MCNRKRGLGLILTMGHLTAFCAKDELLLAYEIYCYIGHIKNNTIVI